VLARSRFPHCRTLQIARTRCVLRTNYEALIHLLAPRASAFGEQHCDFSLQVQVDRGAGSAEPAFFRGMGHLVTARYGDNLFLFDLRRRKVHAWVSRSVAKDRDLWERRFFPLILGVLGCTIGVLPLHSACVVREGRGIFIAGESMAGKSTLAVALAKEGFALLSDDWTYVRFQDRQLVAHGLNAPIKLLPDAVAHFPELQAATAFHTANGEIAYELLADELLHLRVVSSCVPQLALFLERNSESKNELVPASSSFVREYINNSVDRLPRELWDSAQRRDRMIECLGNLPSWRLRYSGSPQAGARLVAHFLEQQKEVVS
jgi:hypothetical protein